MNEKDEIRLSNSVGYQKKNIKVGGKEGTGIYQYSELIVFVEGVDSCQLIYKYVDNFTVFIMRTKDLALVQVCVNEDAVKDVVVDDGISRFYDPNTLDNISIFRDRFR